jgi:hypothetical protein
VTVVTAAWAVSAAAWVEAAVSTAAVAVAIAVVAVVSVVSAVVIAVVVVAGGGVGCASDTVFTSSRAAVAAATVSVACWTSCAFVGGGGEVVSGVVAGGAGIRFVDEEGVGLVAALLLAGLLALVLLKELAQLLESGSDSFDLGPEWE